MSEDTLDIKAETCTGFPLHGFPNYIFVPSSSKGTGKRCGQVKRAVYCPAEKVNNPLFRHGSVINICNLLSAQP